MDTAIELSGSAGITALSRLYGFSVDAAQFAVQHIDILKQVDNALANRCGQLLEAANEGFGVGAETALVLIGVGQALLGNPLTGSTVVSVGTSPVVLTCAAIGAIHYGWKAMSDEEREALLKTVGGAFSLGVEFIRSIAAFAFETIKALMSAENIAELKKLVASVASAFGKRLSEITRALSDRVVEASQYAAGVATGAATTARSYIPGLRKTNEPPPS